MKQFLPGSSSSGRRPDCKGWSPSG